MDFMMLGLVIMLFGGLIGKVMMDSDGGGCLSAAAFIGVVIILGSLVLSIIGTVFGILL